MAENEEAAQEINPQQTEEKKKKKRKPNFSKPFIISGILLGLFAGAPILNLANYILGMWGFVFGLLAAWFMSKEYKYFQIAHGGMVGFFTGLIGSGIAMLLDVGLCLANISTYTLVPALEKVGNLLGIWIPGNLRDAVILAPWNQINEAYRAFNAGGAPALSPTRIIAGHAFFIIPLLAGTSIIGGILGWKLFSKAVPKKQPAPQKRKRPASEAPSQKEKPIEDQAVKSENAPDNIGQDTEAKNESEEMDSDKNETDTAN